MKNDNEIWQQIKKEARFSSEIIDKAKRLGFNPRKLARSVPRPNVPSAKPYHPDFIHHLYEKQFGRKSLLK